MFFSKEFVLSVLLYSVLVSYDFVCFIDDHSEEA